MDLINQQRGYLPTKDWGSTDLANKHEGSCPTGSRNMTNMTQKLAFASTEIDV